MVTVILQGFIINVYDLLDPGATLYFVSPFVAKKFDILPDILKEPLMMNTLISELVVEKRVYRNFSIILYETK